MGNKIRKPSKTTTTALEGREEKTPDKTEAETLSKQDEVPRVSPSRYDAIASLDEAEYNEEERWRERTSIITKFDHEEYKGHADDILKELADQVVTENGSKDEMVESEKVESND